MTIPIEALKRKKEHFERGEDRRALEDPRAELLALEEQGELVVQKIDREAVTVGTKYGRSGCPRRRICGTTNPAASAATSPATPRRSSG